MIHEVNTEKQLLTRTQQPEIKEIIIEEHERAFGRHWLEGIALAVNPCR